MSLRQCTIGGILVSMNERSLKERTERFAKLWPVLNRHYKRDKTFLDHTNVWELLIAVILSAQTSDNGVNKITPTLFKKYPTPQKLMKGELADISKIIHSIGHYNAKARYIKETARLVVEEFQGTVPDTEEGLRSLPGVGRKTAVVVLSNGFGKHVGIAVDTHVIRFAKRFNLSDSSHPDKIEQDLQKIIPKRLWNRAAYAVKEYGRLEGKAVGYKPENDPLQKVL